ncbi:MAG: alpha-glucan family phosphorylase [Nitriliruptoraceae bacterium]|nr:alpha-glucan family phosphorylase [Nitriliruptoraceae bacterium]
MPDASVRAKLHRLAGNLRWFWHAPTRQLLDELAAEVPAQLATNGAMRHRRPPAQVINDLDDATIDRLTADPAFTPRLDALIAGLAEDLEDGAWYAERCAAGQADADARPVAYLSAEFALADALATYSGGLGVLAGDHLRSASELGLPLVAVGLAYRDGYFRQTIDEHGQQHAHAARNDWADLPVTPVLDDLGERISVEVADGDGSLRVVAWQAQVGRIPLILLDTDIQDNAEHHRTITHQLYGGDDDMRVRQEIVLGIGGVRMLAAMGIDPATYHLNEGHAAFAGLERLRLHREAGLELDAALDAVRAELRFTTHTPVPAGHDTFHYDLVRHHLGALPEALQLSFEGLWDLATGPGEPAWNQTVLALKLSATTNGVARLHGAVSRGMFAYLWPERPADEVPIDHITNGVHPSSWVGPEVAALLDTHVDGWRRRWDAARFEAVRDLPADALWEAHTAARHRLIAAVQARLDAQAARAHGIADGAGLDPDALTIGFARRFATYKRGTLIARDVDRLASILASEDRPVQLLIAGKAHPRDQDGQALIRELVHLSRDGRLAGRLVVVEGYDLALGGLLTAGSDVWLNTPLRPMEASGTSGMKAAMNGVLNVSVLDGWWDEAVTDLAPLADVGIGWVIGDAHQRDDREAQDAFDADHLYRVLADQVVPTFHDRDEHGLPQRWIAMMRDSIRLCSPAFSSHRMVADYAARYGLIR